MYHKYTLSSLQKKLNTFFVYIVDTNETELETELETEQT